MEHSTAPSPKMNTLAIVGAATALFVPLIGLVCSIVGLRQIKRRGEGGKGWAIAGIVVSVIVGLLQLLVLVAILAMPSYTLVSYRSSDGGYTVKYPKGWTIVQENNEGTKGVIFKDEYKSTGKVKGQLEMIYVPPPAQGYNTDVLTAIRDSIKTKYSGGSVSYESRESFKGLDSLRMVMTYKGENGMIKAKVTLIQAKNNAVYGIITQAPEENWDRLSDTFDEIHASFQP